MRSMDYPARCVKDLLDMNIPMPDLFHDRNGDMTRWTHPPGMQHPTIDAFRPPDVIEKFQWELSSETLLREHLIEMMKDVIRKDLEWGGVFWDLDLWIENRDPVQSTSIMWDVLGLVRWLVDSTEGVYHQETLKQHDRI